MNNLDKHYMALGLQRGATQEEIRSAFRQMVKQYHPDKDSSLDAQMKYHEAQQAYAALSNATGGGSWESTNPAAGAGQTAHGNNSTGFTNAKKDAANSDGFNDVVRDHPDFKNFYRSYTGGKPEEPNVFANISLLDYFFRARLILTVIGSIAVIFIVMRYITLIPFTDESSARLFRHTAVFVLVTWVVFWYFRFNHSSQCTAYGAILLFGIVYTCWICFYALWPEFHQLARSPSLRYSREIFNVPLVAFVTFAIVFVIAASSLEKGVGLRGTLSDFFRR